MNKTWLIIQREYLSRVRKKSFLLATFLTPLVFPAIIGGIGYLASEDASDREPRSIQVYDPQGVLTTEQNSDFNFINIQGDSLERVNTFTESDDYALLDLSEKDKGDFSLYTKNSISPNEQSKIRNFLSASLRSRNIEELQLTPDQLALLSPKVSLSTYDVLSEKQSNSGVAFGIGYIGGFLIYMFIFLYGSQVMQGVIAEKTNKIAEVILSTVSPFQLMMGKIIGVASVGLTQFLLWVGLIFVFTKFLFGPLGLGSGIEQVPMLMSLQNIDFLPIILTFGFYFIGGYLLYGALFAAIGSAVDSPQEAQQFMFPVTLPLIASIIGLGIVINDPSGNISFWMSIIPLTSPVIMMGRMGFGVPPFAELLTSMALLIGGIFLAIWIASRIYRIGIMAHGSKINFKVLAKWFMQNN